jgi:hypothetical protein
METPSEKQVCRVCGGESQYIDKACILNKYIVSYYLCYKCDFLQTENPYWLNEAYNSSINVSDTGIIQRNIVLSKSIGTLLFFVFNRKAKFLDYAGGYGILTRIMRDMGFDYYTTDPYTTNLVARGFDNVPDKIELVSVLECFEHFEYPSVELDKILKYSRNVFFTTQPRPMRLPPFNEWWYYGLEHGQHIAFYTPKTFRFMAKQRNLNYYHILNYHLITAKKLNSVWYILLIVAGRLGLINLVRLFMKSRTISDQKDAVVALSE